MTIPEAVRQAFSLGCISQTTLNELGELVATSADTRILSILADAITINFVSVTEI